MMIRRAAADDLEPLLALYRQLNLDDASSPPAGEVATLWADMLRDDHLSIFVGELNGGLVASCTLVVVRNLTRGARPFGLVENVVTDHPHRRNGYGTTILRHALAHAWAVNCYKVMLLTGSQREATLRFYEQAGSRRGVKTGFVAVAPDRAL